MVAGCESMHGSKLLTWNGSYHECLQTLSVPSEPRAPPERYRIKKTIKNRSSGITFNVSYSSALKPPPSYDYHVQIFVPAIALEGPVTPPVYSIDLSSYNYTVFGLLNEALKGRQFSNNNEIHAAIEECFFTQPTSDVLRQKYSLFR